MVSRDIVRDDQPSHPGSEAWEKRLLRQARLGDQEAFGRLLSYYQDRGFNLVHRLVSGDAEAQELTQETFLQAFKSISRFREGRPFRPWLFKIAINVCRNYLRSAARRELPQDMRNDNRAWSDKEVSTPEEGYLREHNIQLVEHLLASLSPEERSLLLLRYHEGLSYRELRAVFGKTETVLRKRVQRAIERLHNLAYGALQ